MQLSRDDLPAPLGPMIVGHRRDRAALGDRDRDVAQRLDATESQGDVVDLEQRLARREVAAAQ